MIFVPGRYQSLQAGTFHKQTELSSEQHFTTEGSFSSNDQHYPYHTDRIFHLVSSHLHHAKEKIDAVDIEEKEEKLKSPSFHRYHTPYNHFIAGFYFEPEEDLYYSRNNILPFCEHFAYFSSHSYLLFGVFRI